jgi:hypothetical protein
MSKKLSYRGTLAMGTEERIRLKTIKGKVGYKIVKFQLIGTQPGQGNAEYVGKITKVPDPNIGAVVSITDADMVAVVYNSDSAGWGGTLPDSAIVFDNEIVNQDIYVNITDASGGTTACNYYLELEVVALSDLEATQITLKSIRTQLS